VAQRNSCILIWEGMISLFLLLLAATLGVARAQLLHLSPSDIDLIGFGKADSHRNHGDEEVVVTDGPHKPGNIFANFNSNQDLGEREVLVTDAIRDSGLCDAKVAQHSGYLDAGGGAKYFYWLFESRGSPSEDPLVVWLTGGPGCSSQLALLAENGPCMFDSQGKLTNNPYSWTESANVMWVDQPGDTGFSYGPDPASNRGVAEHMHVFFQSFYEALPQFKANDFYIFGESYGGHYVPAIAHYLWRQAKAGNFSSSLKGIAIGNGITDPKEQMKWYPDMAKDGGKSEGGSLEKSVGLSESVITTMRISAATCAAAISACVSDATVSCLGAYSACIQSELVPYENTGMNVYDMRIKCAVEPLCYDFSMVGTFLNDPETQKKLGVNKTWESCNYKVNAAISEDWVHSFHNLLPDLLADGIRVLIYAGDVDYICNWLGNKKWMLRLEWPHKLEFNAAKDLDYLVDGSISGRLRSTHGLHFLQVYQAGHMVPMDQPAAALQLFNDFLGSKLQQNTHTGSDPPLDPDEVTTTPGYNWRPIGFALAVTAAALIGIAILMKGRRGARDVPVSKRMEGIELPALAR